jgi:hypothetical protein
MNNNELKVVFKAVQDTSVKKVIDNIKGEVNSIGKATSGIFGGGSGSSSFWKLNPGFQQQINAAQQAAKAAMSAPTMQNVIRNWQALGRQKPGFPPLPPFMNNPAFFAGAGGGGRTGNPILQALPTIALLDLAFKTLRGIVNDTTNAFEKARGIYAKSLTSGLGIGFVTGRSQLSQVLGVDEKEVIKFSAAIAYLAPKLQWSNKILTETNRTLTQSAWNFKVFQEDFSAMFAKIGFEAAPSINILIDVLDKLAKIVTEHAHSILGIVGLAGTTGAERRQQLNNDFFTRYPGLMEAVGNTLNRPKGALEDVQDFGKRITEALSKYSGSGLLNIGKMAGLSGTDSQMFKKFILDQKNPIGNEQQQAPNPISYMKQLGASSLERMGLIAGVGGMGAGSHDPSIRTAQNTKKAADLLQQMVKVLNKGSNAVNVFETAVSYL